MRILIQSAIINAVLAAISVFAIIFLYLSLGDIANQETDLTLEWYIAGICLFILALFTISTIITLVLLFKYLINKVDQKKATDRS